MNAAYKAGYARIDWKPLPEPQRAPEARVAASGLACPMVISDAMPLTEHVDGRQYDSKSRFRAVTKAGGYIEVGNDPARHKRPERPKPDRAAIDKAVAQAMAEHDV